MGEASLYERIGGESAVNAAVDVFYKKILADDRIKHFFADTDMVAQHNKQKMFLTYAFGGPNNYTGRSMRAAHAKAVENGLNEDHFNAVAENLQKTLEELGVKSELIDEAIAIAASTKNDVLGK